MSQDFDNYNLEEEEDVTEITDTTEASDTGNGPGKEPEKSDSGEKNDKFSFRTLLRIMTNPVTGWKQLRRMKVKPDIVAGRLFYPLASIAAISCFANFIYTSSATLQSELSNALVVFVSFFFGYFVALSFLNLVLPQRLKDIASSPFVKEVIMTMMSTLAIFFTLYMLLPMLQPVLVFLPLWTIYLISRAGKFMKLPPNKSTTVIGLICTATIGSPVLIAWLFGLIIGK